MAAGCVQPAVLSRLATPRFRSGAAPHLLFRPAVRNSLHPMSFPPDTMMAETVVASPNHDARASNRSPDMIVLHYTGMLDSEAALRRLCSADAKVSAHYFVGEDGRIVQCVPENRRAWHAGESFWAGDTDINSCSIGIEIANPGHEFGYPDFPRRQMAALAALCRSILLRWHVRPERVLAHSDIAPSRKRDPGEKFPWQALHRSGIGHWVPPAPIVEGREVAMGASGSAVLNVQQALRDYGYGVPLDGAFDEKTRDVVTAFQRHFRPARVDGIVDTSMLITLRRLLESRGRQPPRLGSHAPLSPQA